MDHRNPTHARCTHTRPARDRPAHRSTAVRPLRAGVAVTVAVIGLTAVSWPAQAHVEVTPEEVPGGESAVVAFRVPNERDDSATTRLRVLLPQKPALAAVSTTPIAGWKAQVRMHRLAHPVKVAGATLTSAVQDVTWSSTEGGLAPGQFQDFTLDLEGLPQKGQMIFTALQTYDDGQLVRWNEVSADGAAEPEHPAPSLTLTASADDAADTSSSGASGSGSAQETSAQTSAQASAPAQGSASTGGQDDDASVALPTVLSIAALLVALGAAGLAWRRGGA